MAKIDITIPVLNEAESIIVQIEKCVCHFEQNIPSSWELNLIIADNGSTDSTASLAKKLAKEHPMISYVFLDLPGVGRALKYSWGNSHADIVGYMDLDLATDLKHLRPAIETLIANEADVVSGSRLMPMSEVKNRTAFRGFTSRVFNKILQYYMRAKFSDGMCGFKFLQKRHFSKLSALGAQSDGWFFATEILICAEFAKLRILDLPVEWTDDPNSKVRIGRLAMEYIKSMRLLKRRLMKAKNEHKSVL